ncbi:MAG: glycosyltransferase family 2 protein [Acidimicrobiia bacterium]
MTKQDRFYQPQAHGELPRVESSIDIEVSVVIPCLNEAEAVTGVVREALTAIAELGIPGEVLVVDNASIDDSASRAERAGARIVTESDPGYGHACRAGLSNARGRFLVLGDGDGTYDFSALGGFVDPLRNGSDVVMGSRLRGTIEPGAMPWLHRRIGNPLLTWMINQLFSSGVSDAHCGLRSIKKEKYDQLSLTSGGMEFASEFVIEATVSGARIEEVPVNYRRRAGGEPKLRTFRDGWRHVRLMLIRAMGRRRTEETASAAGLASADAGA